MAKKNVHNPYNKFKIWLKDKRLTYKDVAELLGISETCVTAKINGQSDFYLSEIQTIKRTYGIGSDIFFDSNVA